MRGTRGFGRRAALAGALVVGAVMALSGPVAAGGFGPTKVLRTAPEVYLSDIAARGSGVGVVWWEPRAIGPALFYRMSQNGGATFTAKQRLDPRPNQHASAAVCQGDLWIASELQTPEDAPSDWDIVLDGKDLDGSGYSGHSVTDPFIALTSASPAIACVGSRFIALVWLQRIDGEGWHAWLRVMDPWPPFVGAAAGGSATEVDLDLGPAHPDTAPAIDATDGRVVVAWRRGGDLKVRRVDVAPGASVDLDSHPNQQLASNLGYDINVAIAGSRVVIAYTRANDLFTRRSVDGGATFSTAVKRLNGDSSCCWMAYVQSLDIVGKRVLLEGGRAYGDFDPGVEEWRLTSADGGATFLKTKVGSKGIRSGVWAGAGAWPGIVEAWDDWSDGPGDNHIRFHRQG